MRNVFLISTLVVFGFVALGGCGGGGGGGDATPPVPTLTLVTPALGSMLGGTRITLTGSGYSSGSVSVQIGGVFATGVGVVNDTTISCTTPPNATRGPRDVQVNTIGGSDTLTAGFTYQDLFAGQYNYAGFWGDSSVPTGTAEWGLLSADGLGMITGDGVDWNNDSVTGGSPVTPYPYSLDASRRLVMQPGSVDWAGGGISPTGDSAILATIQNGSNPWIFLLSRREGYTTGSLLGDYFMFFIAFSNPNEVALWGTANFDGSGSVATTGTRNSNGGIAGPFPSADSYTVAANGAFTWTGAGGQTHSGGVLLGGDLVICAGGTANGSVPLTAVFIRRSTAAFPASQATLTGPYHYVYMVGTAGAGFGWTSATGTATSNGAGTLTDGGGVTNVDGTTGPYVGGGVLSYTVNANGAMQVTGVDPANGAVTPNGRFACWTGSTTNTEDPQLWFMLR